MSDWIIFENDIDNTPSNATLVKNLKHESLADDKDGEYYFQAVSGWKTLIEEIEKAEKEDEERDDEILHDALEEDNPCHTLECIDIEFNVNEVPRDFGPLSLKKARLINAKEANDPNNWVNVASARLSCFIANGTLYVFWFDVDPVGEGYGTTIWKVILAVLHKYGYDYTTNASEEPSAKKFWYKISKMYENPDKQLKGGGFGISKALLKFMNEDFNNIQAAAKQRGESVNVTNSFIHSLMELGAMQIELQRNIKHLAQTDKKQTEHFITERLDELMKTDEWRNLSLVKSYFYDTPGVDSKWIVKHYVDGNINRMEDIPSRLRQAISDFRSLQKQNVINKTNKIESFDGLTDLEAFLDKYRQNITLKQKDLEIFFEGKELTIYRPKTEEAACYVGQGTKWCTAAKKGNRFAHYNSQGPLYVIQPRVPSHDREKYQLHFQTLQLMDETDHEHYMFDFLLRFPEMEIAFPVLNNENYLELFDEENARSVFAIENWNQIVANEKMGDKEVYLTPGSEYMYIENDPPDDDDFPEIVLHGHQDKEVIDFFTNYIKTNDTTFEGNIIPEQVLKIINKIYLS